MNYTKLISFSMAALLLTSCATVALTGRKQLMLVSDSQVLSLSNSSYKSYMDSAKVSTNKANTAMVVRVGKRIANAVETYMKANGMTADLANYSWEFNLIQNSEANAFCMPGGKIVVYEGILKYASDDASLAVVLGHEVAHAVAKHSAERMSQQLVAQYGSQALSLLLSGKAELTQELAQQVYGLGANYGVMMPFSRKDESEADEMGLIFAAMAGYNPNVAVSFWEKMAQNSAAIPEFLSDHPSDAHRIAALQKEIPTAMQYYKPTTTTTKSAKTTTSKKK
jgi:predicted Zn-dependent protease